MKLFIEKILLYILFVLVFIVSINFISDPAHIFSNRIEKDISSYITKGLNVTYSTNINDRLLQDYLIRKLPYTPEIVILGSSRVMLIGDEYYNSITFNNGVAGASIEDLIAIFSIYERNQKSPNKTVIGVDPWIFNQNNNQERWKSIKEYYDYYKGNIGNSLIENISSCIYEYKQLFSLTYFQSSIRNIVNRKLEIFKPIKVTPTNKRINNSFTKRKDGTISYDTNYREVTDEEIDRKARSYISGNIYSLENFKGISKSLKQEFEDFIFYLKYRGIGVEILLIPYHPIVYDHLDNEYPIINEIEKYINDFGEKNEIKVVGSYNPKIFNLLKSDFYDGMHLQEKGVKKLLSNTP